MIKVSIIVPIYNAEKYLKQCLDSIMNQSMKEIEVILIDDGSIDGSAEICKRYLSDKRVSYYYKKNEGLASARQDGIDKAGGRYIGFVDSDDWVELDAYEKMYKAACINNADIVMCNCIENENGHRFTPEMRTGAFNREQIKKEILPRTLAYVGKHGEKRSIRWSNCLRIYRREFLEFNHIEFDRKLRRSQDLQLTYQATLKAQNYFYLGEEYLYHNRVVNDSLSRGYTLNMWPLYVRLINHLYNYTKSFTEMNLMNQMHLRAFFFVTDCIENEMKDLCPNDKKTKIKNINEIINHPICEYFYGNIDEKQLNPLLQEYYKLIHEKNAENIIKFTLKYNRWEKINKKYWRPFLAFITEAPVIGNLYKIMRKKK